MEEEEEVDHFLATFRVERPPHMGSFFDMSECTTGKPVTDAWAGPRVSCWNGDCLEGRRVASDREEEA